MDSSGYREMVGLLDQMNYKNEKRGKPLMKERILTETFRLFLSKGYDAVSFAEIQEAAEATRGGIFHHFKSKEELLERVAEKFVLDFLKNEEIGNDCLDSPTPLKTFLGVCIDRIEKRVHYFNEEIGREEITSTSFMSFMLYLNGHYEKWKEGVCVYEEQQTRHWTQVIDLAKGRGEIRNINTRDLSSVFVDAYIGAAYRGAVSSGQFVDRLKRDWEFLYQSFRIS